MLTLNPDFSVLDSKSFELLSDFFRERQQNAFIAELYLRFVVESELQAQGETQARTTPGISVDLMIFASVVSDAVEIISTAGHQCMQLCLFRGVAFCGELLQAIAKEAKRLAGRPDRDQLH